MVFLHARIRVRVSTCIKISGFGGHEFLGDKTPHVHGGFVQEHRESWVHFEKVPGLRVLNVKLIKAFQVG